MDVAHGISVPIAEVTPEREIAVCGEDPGWLCRQVLQLTEVERLAQFAGWLAGPPLRVLTIVVIGWFVILVVRRAVKIGLRRAATGKLRRRLHAARDRAPQALFETKEHATVRSEQRVEALALVLSSAAAFAVWVIVVMMVLAEAGISLAPLLAGAGVVGIALGFGAQSLVKDFLSGMFILIEDQFAVGDVVDVGEAVGVVEAVSLRTTRLRSVDGTVWHVPNGEISRVGNQSQHWSRALLDIEVAYDTDIDRASEVIKQVADGLWNDDRDILAEPEVWGVQELGASAILIRLVVKTRPSEQWRISREIRRRLKLAFDEAGIEIPFPQQTVHYRPDTTDRARGRDEAGGLAAGESEPPAPDEDAP